MTNETEQLRDRIAKILSLTYTSGPAKVTFEDIAAAQAIIDEFELTTETHAATHSKRTMTRITGAWEWEKQ